MITLMANLSSDSNLILDLLSQPCINSDKIVNVRFKSLEENLVFHSFKNATVVVEDRNVILKYSGNEIKQSEQSCYLNNQTAPKFLCKEVWLKYLFSPYLLWLVLNEKTNDMLDQINKLDQTGEACVFIQKDYGSNWFKIPQSYLYESKIFIGFKNKYRTLNGLYKPGGFLFWGAYKLDNSQMLTPVGYLARSPYSSGKFFEMIGEDFKE